MRYGNIALHSLAVSINFFFIDYITSSCVAIRNDSFNINFFKFYKMLTTLLSKKWHATVAEKNSFTHGISWLVTFTSCLFFLFISSQVLTILNAIRRQKKERKKWFLELKQFFFFSRRKTPPPPPPYYFFTCYLFSSPLFSRNQIPDTKMAVFINFHQKGTADVQQQQQKKEHEKARENANNCAA